MTKAELSTALQAGKQLDELFEFTPGQECQIFKAKGVAHFRKNNEIVYIPDTDLNEIDTDRVLASVPEIETVLMFCFTGQDFFEICGRNEKMARRVFDACDWQCPGTEYDEQLREEEEDPASLRPSARWIIMRRMANGAKCRCEHCGREETFTTFDPHTQHAFCCRCGYKMEGFCNG